MKTKAIITAVLLAATNMAWASGGLSIDSVDENILNIEPNQAEMTEIRNQDSDNQSFKLIHQ